MISSQSIREEVVSVRGSPLFRWAMALVCAPSACFRASVSRLRRSSIRAVLRSLAAILIRVKRSGQRDGRACVSGRTATPGLELVRWTAEQSAFIELEPARASITHLPVAGVDLLALLEPTLSAA